jgi:hypothetical protein
VQRGRADVHEDWAFSTSSPAVHLDQRVVAALPLPDGPPLADPFLATEDVVLLLELRARQLAT